jgi:hypothetical protein
LDRKYPKEKRSEIYEIYLNEPSLEGELDLGEFTHKNGVKVYISLEVDTSKLVIKNLSEKAEIIEAVQVQEYINQKYPTPQAKATCEYLNIGTKNENNQEGISGKLLEGSLSLKGFTNLVVLNCSTNKLTNLDLTNCSQLTEL